MALPVYKEIIPDTISRTYITQLLKSHFDISKPLVINLTKLGRLQFQALKFFEDCIEENSMLYQFPYALYFIAQVEGYKGNLSVFKSFNQLPRFFKQTDHRPNLKESKVLNKIKLKAEKIASNDLQLSKHKLTNAAQKNKALYLASLEGNFLERLLKKLAK
jgi:hypothetical protein